MRRATGTTGPDAGACRYCGAPVLGRVGPGVCAERDCQTRMNLDQARAGAATAAHDRAVREAGARARAAPMARAALAAAGVRKPESATQAIVPFTGAPLAPHDPARRQAFLDHLDRILAEPADPPDPDRLAARTALEAPGPPPASVACIACRGRCCMLGHATNGFLTAEMMALFRHRNPSATTAEARAAYADRLPDMAQDGGCVFQGDKGCTLPRDLRADVCNSYKCGPLSDLVAAIARAPDAPVLAIGLRADHADHPQGGPGLGLAVTHTADGIMVHDGVGLPPLPLGPTTP